MITSREPAIWAKTSRRCLRGHSTCRCAIVKPYTCMECPSAGFEGNLEPITSALILGGHTAACWGAERTPGTTFGMALPNLPCRTVVI